MKLIAVLSTVLLVAFVGTTLASYLVSRQDLRDRAFDEVLPLISNNIYSDVQRGLMQPIQVSSMMANDTFLIDWALAGEKKVYQVTKYLKEIKEKYGYFTSFFVSGQSGKYYHYQGVHKNIVPNDPHDVWYFNFKKSQKNLSLEVDTDEASGGILTVFINHRLTDYQENFLGVVGVGLKMDQASKILHKYENTYGKPVYLVDRKGVIQMHNDTAIIHKRKIGDPDWFGQRAQRVLNLEGETGSFEMLHEGRDTLIAVRYFPEFGWYLIVEQDEDQVLSSIKTAFYSNLALGFLVTAFIIAVVIVAVNHYQGRLEVLAKTDELTGAPNRRHFFDMLERELDRAGRFGQSVSLIMVDADKFKKVNDNYGHDVGDLVLRALVDTLSAGMRKMDFLGRLGGEEFGLFLPQTRQEDAIEVAERLRQAVENRKISVENHNLSITITLGVATSRPGNLDFKKLMRAADRAMLEAKEAGRNRVGVSGSPEA